MRPSLLLPLLLLIGACEGSAPGNSPTVVVADSPEQVVLNLFEADVTGPQFVAYDRDWFRHQNAREILRTVEIVEVTHVPPRAAVFVRYSVGSRVFRDAHLLRDVGGGKWALTTDQRYYFSSRDRSWEADEAALLDKRVHDWKRESPSYYERVSSDDSDY